MKRKKLIALLLTLAFIISLTPISNGTAKKRVHLNQDDFYLLEGMSVQVKLVNAKQEVKWSVISGKNKVRLFTGNKKSVFVVALKKGTAKIRAKAGKKKYTCIIYVLSEEGNKDTVTISPTPTITPTITVTPTPQPTATLVPTPIKTPTPTVAPTPTASPIVLAERWNKLKDYINRYGEAYGNEGNKRIITTYQYENNKYTGSIVYNAQQKLYTFVNGIITDTAKNDGSIVGIAINENNFEKCNITFGYVDEKINVGAVLLWNGNLSLINNETNLSWEVNKVVNMNTLNYPVLKGTGNQFINAGYILWNRLLSDTKIGIQLVDLGFGQSSDSNSKITPSNNPVTSPVPTVNPKVENQEYGSITGNVSYYYNKYQGNKPDTGTYVYLISKNGLGLKMPNMSSQVDWWWLDSFIKDNKEYGIYFTTVDGAGNYTFNHIPIGDYKLFMTSKNTTSMIAFNNKEFYEQSIVNIMENCITRCNAEFLAKSVGYQNFYTADITIYKNETITSSHDFGTTFI